MGRPRPVRARSRPARRVLAVREVSYVLAFAGGLLGSLHCIGMCGGFVALLAAAGTDPPWRRVLTYNAARIGTLATLGGLAGGLGAAMVAAGPLASAGRVLAVVAGVIIAGLGLEALGWLPAPGRRLVVRVQDGVSRRLGALVRTRSITGPFAFGVLNAFLPCHLLYAFLVVAAGTGSIGAGWLTMVAFGLGTLPAMMAPAAARTVLRPVAGGWLRPLAGGMVVLVGLLTVARGLLPVAGGHLH